MAYQAKKTEHSGPKKGKGAYWGRKVAAKKESNRQRREMNKESIMFEETSETLVKERQAFEMESGFLDDNGDVNIKRGKQ